MKDRRQRNPAFVGTTIILLAIAGMPCLLPAQTNTGTDSGKHSNSSYASCYDNVNGKYIGTNAKRTRVLSSADGRYRAYAKTVAVASPTANSGADCQNTTQLLVAGPGDHKYAVVLTLKSTIERHGNSIEIVDWSANGHRVLITEGSWEWGSDVGENFVRTYDAESGKIARRSLFETTFSKHFGKKCDAVLEPVGFTADSKIVTNVKPWFDVGEDTPSKDSCVDKAGLWAVNLAAAEVKELPADTEVKRYGKVGQHN
jgi:hypothetical protein